MQHSKPLWPVALPGRSCPPRHNAATVTLAVPRSGARYESLAVAVPVLLAAGRRRALRNRWLLTACFSGLFPQRSLHQRRRARARGAVPRKAAASEGVLPTYQLRSICGQRSEPFAVSQLEVQGALPEGFSVAAVSSAGRKGSGSLNQDCVALQLCSDGRWIGVVVDGHGSDGHHASTWLSKALPAALSDKLDTVDMPAAFRAAFSAVETGLESASSAEGFSVSKSGGTVAAAVLSPDSGVAYLVSAGDAQAVVFDVVSGAFQETCPHKAHDEEERARIEAAGGFVKVRQMWEGEVFSRVYDPAGTFGLAMSRSFGDLVVKGHGVIAEPSVVSVPLSESTCCVLGSDGLFEFMTPAEAVEFLMERWDVSGAQACAEALVEEAQKRWHENEGGYCDDVSCLIFGPGGAASETASKASAATPGE